MVAATVLAYSNTLDATFHLDDVPNIVRNESLRELAGQWPPSSNRWLGFLSFALNYRFGGLAVFGYHLVNLLVHVCNGLLVFRLTAITLRTPAVQRAELGSLVRGYLPLTAGLLFALHPVQTQAVTYIVQRFTSLATLFFLLSLVLYAQARLSLEAETPPKRRTAFLYGLSLVAAVGAMKTKEISFTLPLVAAGYELLFFRPRRRWLLLLPLGATALLVPLGLTTQDRSLADVLGDAGHLAAETLDIPRSTYLLTQSRVVVTYLRLLLVPVGQNLDYDFRLSHSLADPGVLFALTILLGVAAAALFLLRRARETNRPLGALVFFGTAWFFVTLSVESSVIPIRDVIFEHRMYLPSVGAAVALGIALLGIVERLPLRIAPMRQVAIALLITAAPLGVATYARNFVWNDEVSLWSDVVSKSPQKGRSHTNLGAAYQAVGQLDYAMREYQQAIQLDPGDAQAHNNLGTVFRAKGQFDDAIREYHETMRLNPRHAAAHSNLGNVYQARGQLDEAVRECQEAIRIDPGLADAHQNLASAYEAKGRLDDAAREYREAFRLDPSSRQAGSHNNLGNLYQAKGSFDEALAEYREALRSSPDSSEAHNNLGTAYAAKGWLDDAAREYQRAIRLDPRKAEAYNNLGNVYKAKRQFDDAIREYQQAVRLAPELAMPHNNLGEAHAASGRLNEAVREFQAAIRLDPGLAEAHSNLGGAHEAQGHLDDALREYREAIRLDPALAEAYNNLAAVLVKQGHITQAIEQLRRVLAFQSRLDPAIMLTHPLI